MKLSVLIITYNHEKYIGQALESALMQNLNFEYEIVVGEDCSSDNTRSILIEYQKKNPHKIRLLLHKRNLGSFGKYNFVETLKTCKGEYVAILEGDDYWTDPFKLQKQMDFLESHPDCTLCFHNVKMVYEEAGKSPHPAFESLEKNLFTIQDLLSGNFIHTCSTMFRAGAAGEIPEWFFLASMGDWPLFILHALHGNIGYIDEILAAYRIHSGGVWSSARRSDILKSSINTAEVLKQHLNLNPKFRRIINSTIARWHHELAKTLYEEKNLGAALEHTRKSVSVYPLNALILIRSLLRGVLKIYFTRLHSIFR